MKKCAVTPRKDAVIPGFDQISALILMITALLNNDRIVSSKCISADLLRNFFSLRYLVLSIHLFTEFFTINLGEGTLVAPMKMANF